MMRKAVYHLPGLFEFYELYKAFLPIYAQHKEYFYDWCEIGSIYGAPGDCLWGGGRACEGAENPKRIIELLEKYGIQGRLTLSNSRLREEHLSDKRCNSLCQLFEDMGKETGIIIYSDLLLDYIKKSYKGFYFVSSTTKVLTEFEDFVSELNRSEYKYVVLDFRLNKKLEKLNGLNEEQKNKTELLCNECCYIGCTDRKACYENVSMKCLGEKCEEHICRAPGGNEGYRLSKAMENPAFIGVEDIKNTYLPMGFTQFKLEGRGLGSAVVFEILLYYMIKPEYHLIVREMVYLDSMLDLF